MADRSAILTGYNGQGTRDNGQKAYEVFDETTYRGYHVGCIRDEMRFKGWTTRGSNEPGEVRTMHIPDALLEPRVAAITGVVGAAGLLYALRKLEHHLGERTTVLMGTMSAFVFAGQMVNFPVLYGVSGHLLGGVLSAVLLGPWAGSGGDRCGADRPVFSLR